MDREVRRPTLWKGCLVALKNEGAYYYPSIGSCAPVIIMVIVMVVVVAVTITALVAMVIKIAMKQCGWFLSNVLPGSATEYCPQRWNRIIWNVYNWICDICNICLDSIIEKHKLK